MLSASHKAELQARLWRERAGLAGRVVGSEGGQGEGHDADANANHYDAAERQATISTGVQDRHKSALQPRRAAPWRSRLGPTRPPASPWRSAATARHRPTPCRRRKHHVIARHLALGLHPPPRKPDQRVVPVQGAGDLCDQLREAVPPPGVGHLVQQHRTPLFGGPRARVLRQQQPRTPQPPGHGHRPAWAADQFHRPAKVKLAAHVAEHNRPCPRSDSRGSAL